MDYLAELNDAVTHGLAKADFANTPENRVIVLQNLYRSISAMPGDNPNRAGFLQVIEEEIIRLETLQTL